MNHEATIKCGNCGTKAMIVLGIASAIGCTGCGTEIRLGEDPLRAAPSLYELAPYIAAFRDVARLDVGGMIGEDIEQDEAEALEQLGLVRIQEAKDMDGAHDLAIVTELGWAVRSAVGG